MSERIIKELANEQGQLKRFRLRKRIFGSLENLEQGARQRKNFRLSRPDFLKLKEHDEVLQKVLVRKNPECAIKTTAERAVFETIRKHTALKFHQSFWIGNRNVDLFCPAIGTLQPPIRKGHKVEKLPVMRGWVIEVDGQIHHSEPKDRKDQSKYWALHDLQLGLTVIDNSDSNSSEVRHMLAALKNTSRLDQRARERVLRKIFVTNLLCHADDQTIAEFYGPQYPNAVDFVHMEVAREF